MVLRFDVRRHGRRAEEGEFLPDRGEGGVGLREEEGEEGGGCGAGVVGGFWVDVCGGCGDVEAGCALYDVRGGEVVVD